MAPIGFSTGTLALGDFRLGIQMLQSKAVAAVELSALREEELKPLVQSLDALDLQQFTYISLHAPSRLVSMSEASLVEQLSSVFARGWPVVLHPDVISTPQLWHPYGELVCIENMDKRKFTGRTASELETIFSKLPAASLCFDIGHARQVDPTMGEATAILRQHGHRLKQLHLSDVNTASQHEPLSFAAENAFARVARLIPEDIPVIMETPVPVEWIEDEIRRARRVLFSAG